MSTKLDQSTFSMVVRKSFTREIKGLLCCVANKVVVKLDIVYIGCLIVNFLVVNQISQRVLATSEPILS